MQTKGLKVKRSANANRVKMQVEKALQAHPQLRNDDYALCVHIWTEELLEKGSEVEEITAQQFLTYFANRLLLPLPAIVKARQELQDRNRELRGPDWADRRIQEYIDNKK
jgi:hypothetical protein